ncbi:hypothetical protein [Streptomyces boninensis]|uniref:hypothetical protein n=1 Tax=Streptomyces boninensis TaxID=2039455 RepID=UPI003B212D38
MPHRHAPVPAVPDDDARTLTALGLGGSPLQAPLTYPGALPAESGLLVGDRFLRLVPEAGVPVGAWLVEDGGCEALDVVLGRLGLPPCGERTPVLAVGSNGAPGQLRRKFRRLPERGVVPLTRVRVRGVAAGVSAHVGRAGYVPATPVPAGAGRTAWLAVSWLDDAQLPVMDATELAYERLALAGSAVELPSGEAVPECEAYVSRHGWLAMDDSRTAPPRPLLPQPELLAALLAESAGLRALFGDTPEEFAARAAADEEVRERARKVFAAEGWVRARR